MKNAIGTLLMFAMVVAAGVGAFVIYKNLSGSMEAPKKQPEEVAAEIENRIGIPFLKAWADRDLKQMAVICRGEFAVSVPEYAQWNSTTSQPFEIKRRAGGEEEQNSIEDMNEIFGYFFDPISGLNEMQTEFSVSRPTAVKGTFLWDCKILLEARGFDDEGFARVYSTEGILVVSLPPEGNVMPASIRVWEISSEVNQKSHHPIKEELVGSLAKENSLEMNGAKVWLDIADFDNDNDQDIAVTVSTDASTVRGLFVFENGEYVNRWDQLIGEAAMSSDSNPRTIWIDLDRNGKPDLVFGNHFFENQNGEAFLDVSDRFMDSNTKGSGAVSSGEIRRSSRL